MDSNKSIRKNYLYNMGYQLLLLVVPLIVAPYVSRVLGADGIGTYSYTLSVVSYFVLFATLGTVTYGQRAISYVQESKVERTIVFWETWLFRLFTSVAAIAVYVVFCSFQTQNRTIYLIFSLNILAVITDISWFFQGIEEFGKIVGRNAIFKIINIAFIFTFVNEKTDLLLYILGMCAIPLVGNLLMWALLPKYIVRISGKNINPFRRVREIISLFVPTIAIQVYTVMDKTMIGVITRDSFQNGYYNQAETLSKTTLTIVTALGVVLIPRIGYYYSQNKKEEIRAYMYRSYQFAWMMAIPLCCGLIGISSNLVPWYYGSGFDDVIPLLRVLSLLLLAIGINNVTGMQYLIPTERQNTFTFTVCIGAFVNFIGNFFLIRYLGAMGAAVSSVAAESSIAIVQLIIVRKEIDPLHVLRLARNYVIAGIVMMIMVLIESRYLSPSIIHSLVMVISGAVAYYLVLVLLKDEFFVENVNKYVQKVKQLVGRNG